MDYWEVDCLSCKMMPDPMEHVQPRSNLGTVGNFSITSPIAQTSPQVIFISSVNWKNMVVKAPPQEIERLRMRYGCDCNSSWCSFVHLVFRSWGKLLDKCILVSRNYMEKQMSCSVNFHAYFNFGCCQGYWWYCSCTIFLYVMVISAWLLLCCPTFWSFNEMSVPPSFSVTLVILFN